MPSFLIDPATETVEEIDFEGDFLAAVRRAIGCAQLTVAPVAENRFAVWMDAFGMLKPGRAFWSFSDSDYRFAGRCVITGITAEGIPCPFPGTATTEMIAEGVRFFPSEVLKGIIERLDTANGVPLITRVAVWSDLSEPEEAAPEPFGWAVHEREDGTYRAVQYRLDSERLEPTQMFTAASLDEIRQRLPAGLTRVEPADADDDTLVENWI